VIRDEQKPPTQFERAPRESHAVSRPAATSSCDGARSYFFNHFLITVPGILSDAEDAFAWHEESIRITWDLTNGGLWGESFDYELGLVRWLPKQRRAIDALVQVLLRWKSRRLIVVVHSNGSHMITQALGRLLELHMRGEIGRAGLPRIETLHLIAPSCEADCTRNFLNGAVSLGLVGNVFLYQPQSDRVVKFGHWWRKPFGWLGWGHGNLSVAGFQNVRPDLEQHFITIPHGRDHTDAVKAPQLRETMELILAQVRLAAGHQTINEGSES
jgi:hypothetical protein